MESDEKAVGRNSKNRSKSKSERLSSSSLSARLHPDFDAAENVTKAFFAENRAEEINPKTAVFEELVELLHPTFIFEYFEKILQFLNSRHKELCFPMIAPFKEAFLVRIAKNNSYLRSSALDDKNRHLGAEILQVLEKNRNVFRWVYTYEDGIINKNVLVYKKQFVSETQNDHKKGVSSKQPSATSLATSLEDMSLSQERQENISRSFKTNFLNTTLKFIKNTNQLILEYPEMRLAEGRYMYSLIYNRNECGALGLGFRSMYSFLHEAIEELEKDFDLNVSFRETRDVNTIRLLLEKVRKPANGASNKSDLNSSTVSTSSVESVILPDIIKQLPDSFVKPTLERAVEFLEDDKAVTLNFQKLRDDHSKLVTSIPKICRQDHLFELFSPECRKLLKRIKTALKNDTWKLQILFGKTCKRTFTRNINYSKEPAFGAKGTPLKSVVVRKDTTPVQSKHNESVSRGGTPTERLSANKDAKTDNKRNFDNSGLKAGNSDSKGKKANKYIDFQSAGVETADATRTNAAPSDVSLPADVYISAKRKKIMDALTTPLESDRAERMMRNMGWDGGALGARGDGIKEPILPALHLTPGAGLGHVSPLPEQRPHQGSQPQFPLHFRVAMLNSFLINELRNSSLFAKPGAGLGHVKPAPEQQGQQSVSKSPLDFRIALLKTFLGFIKSSDQKMKVYYRKPLIKKQFRFIAPSLRTLNDRKNLGLSNSKETDLVTEITNRMLSDPTLFIGFKLNQNFTELTLTKEISSGDYPTSTRKKNGKPKTTNSADVKNYIRHVKNDLCDVKNDVSNGKNDVNDVKELVDVKREVISTLFVLELAGELEGYCASLKMAKSIAFRVIFLEKLRRFLGDKSEVLEIKFDVPINVKHTSYVESVISEINKRQWVKKASGVENDVYKEIQKLAGDCFLCIVIGVQKILIKKKFYQKRFTNSALDPPKSQDVKNTIIYKNDRAYRPEEIDLHKEDDKNDIKITNIQNIDENDSDADIIDIDDGSNVNFDSEDTMSIDKTDHCDIDSKDLTSLNISCDSVMLDILNRNDTSGNLDGDVEKTEPNSEVNNDNGDTNRNDSANSFKHRNSRNDFEAENSSSSKYSSVSCLERVNGSKYVKNIVIVPKCGGVYNIENIRLVQKLISDSLNEDIFLPRLECQGIQNGGLTYSCHSEKTLNWLKDTLSVANDVRVIATGILGQSYKIKMKISSYIPQDVVSVLRKLELYNPGLSTNSWELLKEEVNENSIEMTFKLDEDSYECICQHNLSLFMGIDKAKFSIVWD